MNFLCVDSSPIIEHTRNIVVLDEGEIAIISKIKKQKNRDKWFKKRNWKNWTFYW